MTQDITDVNSVIVKIGGQKAGGADGILIIDEFEVGVDPQKEKKYGVGNQDAKGRTGGNREITLSFTHIGQNTDLAEEVNEGNFDVVLNGDKHNWEIDDVDGAFTISISDGGDYEFDFDGDALGYELVS